MKHGKTSTYTNHKCRCSLCREAWRVYVATYRRTGAYRAANIQRAQQMEQERKP